MRWPESDGNIMRLGQGFCAPISSSYSHLTCLISAYRWNEGTDTGSYSKTLTITLWDQDVAADPMLAFGSSMTGCLRWNDHWRSTDTISFEDCALRCLNMGDCESFDYRPRFSDCRFSRTSFTSDKKATDQKWADCRYYEMRTVVSPSIATSLDVSGFRFKGTSNPHIKSLYLQACGFMQTSTATERVGKRPDTWVRDDASAPRLARNLRPNRSNTSSGASC